MTKVTNLETARRKRTQRKVASEGDAVRCEPYTFDDQVMTTENTVGNEVIVVVTGEATGLVMEPESAMRLGLALHAAGLKANIKRIERERPDLVEQMRKRAGVVEEPLIAVPQPTILVPE